MSNNFIAVGDIHGQYKKLTSVLEQIKHNYDGETVVFLGDYVDKGSHSRECIDLLIDLKNSNVFKRIIFLKGNHDYLLYEVISKKNKDLAAMWFNKYSGDTTVLSYTDILSLEDFCNSVSIEHVEFFQNLSNKHETKHIFFCHSGANGSKKLSEQNEIDLLWMRPSSKDMCYDKVVIHGHTPVKTVKYCKKTNRINIDLGAGSGKYICAIKVNAKGKILREFRSENK